MTFVHGYLLGGMLLVTVPILIHLIMRQKPKHVRFPAFRFLRQKFDVTQNRLRIQHWLLLLLRILVILFLCLALARPRLFSDKAFVAEDQPVAVVLVFDTSMSMEYQHAGDSRLEVARARALQLLDELPPGSKVAVIDRAEPGAWAVSVAAAREQVQGLQVRPDGGPVTRQITQAYTLLNNLEKDLDPGQSMPPRLVYVFSDRTYRSWDPGEARSLKYGKPEDAQVVYVDAGIDKPSDLSIDRVEFEPQQVPPGGTVTVRVTVRASGTKAEGQLLCSFDGDPDPDQKLVHLAPGESQLYTFERHAAKPGQRGLAEGFHQVGLTLKPDDALPYNNVRYGTFAVRAGRNVLTVVDRADSDVELFWRVALEVRGYRCDSISTAEFAKLDAAELKKYHVVALFEVADPPPAVFDRLLPFVDQGGGLAVIPAGGDMNNDAYNKGESAGKLLPGTWEQLVTAAKSPGVGWNWSGAGKGSLFLEPFERWRKTNDVEFQRPEGEPMANRYWQVKPAQGGTSIVTYNDAKAYPVLLERRVGRGKVLQFTTPLDVREEVLRTNEPKRRWHNYWENSFGLVLVDRACRYLAGDSEISRFNYICGDLVTVPLDETTPGPFRLRGTAIKETTLAEARDPAPGKPRELALSRAVSPGNYQLINAKDATVTDFSLAVHPEEGLLERVPATEIEDVLGEGAVVSSDEPLSLGDVLHGEMKPLELLPLFLLLLLVALAVENLLGNLNRKFHKPTDDKSKVAPEPGFGMRDALTLVLWGGGGALVGAALGWWQILGYPGAALGALVTGLLGLVHAILVVSNLPARGGSVLGGLLGAMVGVIYGGGLLLRLPSWEGPPLIVLAGLVGGVVMALDGWLTATWRARRAPEEAPA